MLSELARKAKEEGAVIVLIVAPDGAYFQTSINPELAEDSRTIGPYVFGEFNHMLAELRKTRGQ